jgi:hypothetical protein
VTFETWIPIESGLIGTEVTATTEGNHWEQLSTGSFLVPVDPLCCELLSL